MSRNRIVIGPSALVLAALLVAASMPFAAAQASEEGASTPAAAQGCAADRYRDFDFWLGRWEVRLEDGTRAGSNVIEATRDGCLIEERWTGARGSRGYSMNFYDPAGDQWRQLWVSANGIIEIAGGLEDGSMVLEGHIRYRDSGASLPFRGRWTPQSDGRVRQFFEEHRDGAWQPWFEGFYSKVVE